MSKTIQTIKRNVIKNLKKRLKIFKKRNKNHNLSKQTLMLLTALEHFANTQQRLIIDKEDKCPHALQAIFIIDEVLDNDIQVVQRIEKELSLLRTEPLNSDEILLFWQSPEFSYPEILKRLKKQLLQERPLIPALLSIELLESELKHDDISEELIMRVGQIKSLLKKVDKARFGSSQSIRYSLSVRSLLNRLEVPVEVLKPIPGMILNCLTMYEKATKAQYEMDVFHSKYPLISPEKLEATSH